MREYIWREEYIYFKSKRGKDKYVYFKATIIIQIGKHYRSYTHTSTSLWYLSLSQKDHSLPPIFKEEFVLVSENIGETE